MELYDSENVKVFPTIRRNDKIDRNARLNTEENIVGLSNNISGGQSYILEGLTIENNKLSAGTCIINGYYFKIENTIPLQNIGNPQDNNNNYLYFQIRVKEINGFKELVDFESGERNKLLDFENSFTGLNIEYTNNLLDNKEYKNGNTQDIIYNLLIAEKVNNK